MSSKKYAPAWRVVAALFPAISLAVVFHSGCSQAAIVCPTSGVVLVNGKPAGGAYVVFHPVNDTKRENRPDTARTLKDGSFATRVRGAGEYAVTVFWPRVTEADGEVVEGEDYFQGKFRSPAQPVLKLTIRDGDNTVPPISLKYP